MEPARNRRRDVVKITRVSIHERYHQSTSLSNERMPRNESRCEPSFDSRLAFLRRSLLFCRRTRLSPLVLSEPRRASPSFFPSTRGDWNRVDGVPLNPPRITRAGGCFVRVHSGKRCEMLTPDCRAAMALALNATRCRETANNRERRSRRIGQGFRKVTIYPDAKRFASSL